MSRPTFEELKARPTQPSTDELDAFFAELEPVEIDGMMGPWKGGVFPSGSFFDSLLRDFKLIRWHGKSFESENRVRALVGRFLGLGFNFPGGGAVLRRVEFRGQVSAAMIYDHLPIIDHFRRIDDRAVMGVMDRKGKIEVYFYLDRED